MTLEFWCILHWFNRVIDDTETLNIFYIYIYIYIYQEREYPFDSFSKFSNTHLLVGVFIHIPDMYIGSIILNHIIGVVLSYPL